MPFPSLDLVSTFSYASFLNTAITQSPFILLCLHLPIWSSWICHSFPLLEQWDAAVQFKWLPGAHADCSSGSCKWFHEEKGVKLLSLTPLCLSCLLNIHDSSYPQTGTIDHSSGINLWQIHLSSDHGVYNTSFWEQGAGVKAKVATQTPQV